MLWCTCLLSGIKLKLKIYHTPLAYLHTQNKFIIKISAKIIGCLQGSMGCNIENESQCAGNCKCFPVNCEYGNCN